jgi:hypothetical protein
MTPDVLETTEREIERLRSRYATLLREWPRSCELTARWILEAQGLRWFVSFDQQVLEPDIDVEITTEVLVVRARPVSDDQLTLLGLLPVPSGFDIEDPMIHYSEGSLEIRIRHRSESGAAR